MRETKRQRISTRKSEYPFKGAGMSIKIMSWVFDYEVSTTGADRLVLLALADNANDDGVCWPSLSTIARKAGVDRTTAIRAIDRLIKSGLLTKTPRQTEDGRQTSNVYRIMPGGSGATPPYSSATQPQKAGSSGATPPPQSHSATPPVAESHPPSGATPPESSLNPHPNHQLTQEEDLRKFGTTLFQSICTMVEVSMKLSVPNNVKLLPVEWDPDTWLLTIVVDESSPGWVMANRFMPHFKNVIHAAAMGLGIGEVRNYYKIRLNGEE